MVPEEMLGRRGGGGGEEAEANVRRGNGGEYLYACQMVPPPGEQLKVKNEDI